MSEADRQHFFDADQANWGDGRSPHETGDALRQLAARVTALEARFPSTPIGDGFLALGDGAGGLKAGNWFESGGDLTGTADLLTTGQIVAGDEGFIAPSGGAGLQDGYFFPRGITRADNTTQTAIGKAAAAGILLGKVTEALSTIDLVLEVTTAYNQGSGGPFVQWCEVGVFKGTPSINANPTLTRCGTTNVAATFNSTGVKVTTVALSGVAAGDHLWALVGSNTRATGTAVEVRGGLADIIQAGIHVEQGMGTSKLSDITSPSAWTLAGNTIVPPFIGAM